MSWSHPETLAENVQATGVFGCFVDPKADGVVSGYTKALDGPSGLHQFGAYIPPAAEVAGDVCWNLTN